MKMNPFNKLKEEGIIGRKACYRRATVRGYVSNYVSSEVSVPTLEIRLYSEEEHGRLYLEGAAAMEFAQQVMDMMTILNKEVAFANREKAGE